MQPIVVRKLSEPTAEGVKFQLVMGERRWRAGKVAGLDLIRRSSAKPPTATCCVMRCWRHPPRPAQSPWEAAAYQQLLRVQGICTRTGRRIGRAVITNMIRLLKLPFPCSVGWRQVCCRPVTRTLLSLEAAPACTGARGAYRRRGTVGAGHRRSGHARQPGRHPPPTARRKPMPDARSAGCSPSGCPTGSTPA